jgi:hypothetical protein
MTAAIIISVVCSYKRQKSCKGNGATGFKMGQQNLPQHDLATLPFAGKTGGQPGIFNGNKDYQGPNHKRQDSQDVVVGWFRECKNDGKSINRAGAYVAKDQSHRFNHTAKKGLCFRLFQEMYISR